MSLEGLKVGMRRATDESVNKISQEAQEEAKRIIAEAKKKAEAIREEKMRAKRAELEAEERAELAMTRMEWRRKILEVKAECLNQVFEEAEKRLRDVIKAEGKPKYNEILLDLAVEGAVKMRGKRFIILSNARDRETLRDGLKRIKKRVGEIKGEEVDIELGEEELKSMGGVMVYTSDMRQYYNNTLEARLLKSRERLKGEVFEMLFRRG
ncbi:MAG: V-type ATP synthase subunit E [Candidatus Geothermarchaeales archaeon]